MIRPLGEPDLDAYIALRREALFDLPLAFAASPEDDFASDREALRASLGRAPDWILFGAFDGDNLVGIAGMIRDRHVKAAHKMHLWGMYVTPLHRRRGLAAALLAAAIEHARNVDGIAALHLGVTTAAADAHRVYERAGFVTWGTEPDALRADGRAVGEVRMVLAI